MHDLIIVTMCILTSLILYLLVVYCIIHRSGRDSLYETQLHAAQSMLRRMEQEEKRGSYLLVNSLTGECFSLSKKDFHQMVSNRPQYPELN